ncbi:acid protease [Gloeopeniophorella convolvens]|nr:acid protease [Gloeopeniophorella convolvens]
MKLSAFALSFALCAAPAFAARFPVQKISRSSLHRRSGSAGIFAHKPHVLASSASIPDDADLSTVNDMIYIANITVGGNAYRVQLDTGSSDLWIKGQNTPLPNSEQTATLYNLSYGIGWAYGHISYSSAEFAGIPIPKQAFLDVSSAQNPALTYGTSGILGLGFTSLSSIDAMVNGTGSSSGRSLLYNLFNDNPHEPNFIAFSLQRSSDPTDEVEGTFLIGEVDPEYAAVNNSAPIHTFPENSPMRWNLLLDAILVGPQAVPVTSTVAGAPSNRAVALLDSGTSYTYLPKDVCQAIYGNVPGAKLDQASGTWDVPCDAEIDLALQFDGQIFPVHPLDVVPKSLTEPGKCMGSFIPQDFSSVGAGNFDMIVGDNFLRSVYSVYDFGDFDASGHMGSPYIKLLTLVEPNAASQEFASARGSVPRTNITFSASNSTVAASTGSSTVTLPDDVTNTLHRINLFLPIMIAILGVNAIVVLLLAAGAFIYMFRHRSVSGRNRRSARRLTPMPLAGVSTDAFEPPRESGQHSSLQHVYQPVSMALTDDTFVPPSPAFHQNGGLKARTFDDRPNSVA